MTENETWTRCALHYQWANESFESWWSNRKHIHVLEEEVAKLRNDVATLRMYKQVVEDMVGD